MLKSRKKIKGFFLNHAIFGSHWLLAVDKRHTSIENYAKFQIYANISTKEKNKWKNYRADVYVISNIDISTKLTKQKTSSHGLSVKVLKPIIYWWCENIQFVSLAAIEFSFNVIFIPFVSWMISFKINFNQSHSLWIFHKLLNLLMQNVLMRCCCSPQHN